MIIYDAELMYCMLPATYTFFLTFSPHLKSDLTVIIGLVCTHSAAKQHTTLPDL